MRPMRLGPGLAGLALLLALGAGCAAQQEEVALSALHYFERGNAAFQAEDYRRAIRHYRKAAELDPAAPEFYYNLGLAYYRVSSFEQAGAAFSEAVRRDPEFAEAHLNLALTYDKLYNLQAAHAHYNTYRELVAGRSEAAGDNAGARQGATARAAPGRRNDPGVPGAARPGAGGGRQAQPAGQGPQGVTTPRQRAAQPARPGREAPAGQPNPFKGSPKWWTQDLPRTNR